MLAPWVVTLQFWTVLVIATEVAAMQAPRCLVYLTGQHPIVPDVAKVERVTHVALAFMKSSIFNEPGRSEWPLFSTVESVRSQFAPGTKIMVAVGGWGDTDGFSTAATTEASRTLFAENVANMVFAVGADGVDIDWEYPGGNGEDYKRIPNSEKAWEIEAYPLLMAAVRKALGPRKLLSAAVPGLPRDMLAFTRETVPRIMRQVDFLNVMTYDLMNRRDSVTKHHTGIELSQDAIEAYIMAGAAPQQLNLGFAFYVKWFRTEHDACATHANPVGCPTILLEDPITGDDLGGAGAFSWHDAVPEAIADSFQRALDEGTYDEQGGGYYFWDEEEDLWWTYDTADAVKRKVSAFFRHGRLGGAFSWGLGEDAPLFEHLDALTEGLAKIVDMKDEL